MSFKKGDRVKVLGIKYGGNSIGDTGTLVKEHHYEGVDRCWFIKRDSDGSELYFNWEGELELLEESKSNQKFKIGDRIVGDGIFDGLDVTGRTGTIKGISDISCSVEFDEKIPSGHDCSGKTKYGHGWQVEYSKVKLLKSNQNKNMSSIVKFVKNLALSADEKLLREMGLKDDCGDYTEEAKEIAINKLLDDSQAHLVDIATKMKADKKAKKDDCKTCE